MNLAPQCFAGHEMITETKANYLFYSGLFIPFIYYHRSRQDRVFNVVARNCIRVWRLLATPCASQQRFLIAMLCCAQSWPQGNL